MANLKYWLWLTLRKGLAGQNLWNVLEHFGSPEGAYAGDEAEYRLVPGLGDMGVRSLLDKSLDGADRILGECDRLSIRVMTVQDAIYPERLRAIHQPPAVLYWKGREVAFDEEAAVAVVGTRDATPYGVRVAGRLAFDLTGAGALVLSGMAQGIDSAALRGALKAGGPVVSVVGNGLDVVYPRYHRGLYEDVAAAGTLLSEYPPGTEPRKGNFPARNRILSGLSAGVAVVESRRSGGSLITAGHALEQDREVFAVPGPVDGENSEGTNRLIQEGAAKLIMGAEDILCEFVDRYPNKLRPVRPMSPDMLKERLVPPPEEGPKSSAVPAEPPEKEVDNPPALAYIDWKDYKTKLTDDQRKILLTLEERPQTADDLVEKTQIPARRVLAALTILEIQGLAAEESGKRFRAAVRLKME